MRYQVLILMAEEKLAAMDVDTEGRAELISVEGNTVMKYSSAEEAKDFCRYLKDYYNIERFSDIDLSITVVRFDAPQHAAVCLLEAIKDADECNLVSAEKLLPLLLLKEGIVKPDKVLQVEIFGITYLAEINGDLKIVCKKGGEERDKLNLPVERLSLYYCFDANHLIDDQSELRKCQDEFQKELSRKEDMLKAEKERADAAEAKIEKLFQIVKRIKDQKNKNAKRYVCRVRIENNNDSVLGVLVSSMIFTYRAGVRVAAPRSLSGKINYRIEYAVNDSDVVINNQRIAIAKAYLNGERMSNFDIDIKAPAVGRIFCLMSKDSTVRDGDAVALIGDLADSKEEIIQWYEKNKQ